MLGDHPVSAGDDAPPEDVRGQGIVADDACYATSLELGLEGGRQGGTGTSCGGGALKGMAGRGDGNRHDGNSNGAKNKCLQ